MVPPVLYLELIFHFSPSNSFCLWKAKLEKFFTRKEAQAYIQSKQQKNFLLQIDKKTQTEIKNQKRTARSIKMCQKTSKFIHSEENHKKQSPR